LLDRRRLNVLVAVGEQQYRPGKNETGRPRGRPVAR
jgi:hypothetical protein